MSTVVESMLYLVLPWLATYAAVLGVRRARTRGRR